MNSQNGKKDLIWYQLRGAFDYSKEITMDEGILAQSSHAN